MKKNLICLCLLACSALAFTVKPIKKTAKQFSYIDTVNRTIPDPTGFNATVQGQPVSLYVLKNNNKASVAITNYGARLVSIIVPDKGGNPTDVILGYDNIQSYQKRGEPYFGAIVGRYGNRIAKGKFTLGDKSYQLESVNGQNTLHSGSTGFYSRVFAAKQINDQQLQLTYFAKDGEGGFPGNLNVTVLYTLTNDNALKIEYTATTDQTTVINLTNHAYFNLNGAGSKTITADLLKINADNYLPIDNTSIPTGKLESVAGTPFDFRNFKAVGADIGQTNEQLKLANGYDHNFILNKHTANQPVATVKASGSGITMDVYTDQPGLQFYSGNFLNAFRKDGKGGIGYGSRSALCLETQHYPDSPNQPTFPSTVLEPGKKYHSVTTYKFSNK